MKKALAAVLLVMLGFLAGCCTRDVVNVPVSDGPSIETLRSMTVELTHFDVDGDFSPYCTAVWVTDDRLLTAEHCARALLEDRLVTEALKAMDEGKMPDLQDIKHQVDVQEDGTQLDFVIDGESNGLFRQPKRIRVATVLRHDYDHDLALLVVANPPEHAIARIADKEPNVGDEIHVMGHVMGLEWTYTRCRVSGFRPADFVLTRHVGPWIQVAGEVYKGNSGGGGFNEAGELEGIVSFLVGAPNESFFIHVDTIRSFVY